MCPLKIPFTWAAKPWVKETRLTPRSFHRLLAIPLPLSALTLNTSSPSKKFRSSFPPAEIFNRGVNFLDGPRYALLAVFD
jgi:hypothetical protein